MDDRKAKLKALRARPIQRNTRAIREALGAMAAFSQAPALWHHSQAALVPVLASGKSFSGSCRSVPGSI
jgi:hypothetical protein